MPVQFPPSLFSNSPQKGHHGRHPQMTILVLLPAISILANALFALTQLHSSLLSPRIFGVKIPRYLILKPSNKFFL